MRKLIALVVAGVLPFAGAAYLSWKWQAAETPPSDEVEHTGEKEAVAEKQQASPAKPAEKRSEHARSAAPPNSPAPSAEEAVQLVANLRNQLASVRQRETQFANRQKQIDLVYQDI